MSKAFVAGVGMIPFTKPGANEPYPRMAAAAGRLALADAGIEFDALQQAYVGYVYGDSTSGQKALYSLGMTGIPVFNVNNNCSTGSTALFLARQAIESGAADCVLALGFEQMNPGALGTVFNDRPSPFEDFDREAEALVGMPELPLALRYFGGAGLAHMEQLRHAARGLREGARQGEPARSAQPACAAAQGAHGRRRDERTDALAGRADPPDGLPADLRRSGGGARLRAVRQATSACAPMCSLPRRR